MGCTSATTPSVMVMGRILRTLKVGSASWSISGNFPVQPSSFAKIGQVGVEWRLRAQNTRVRIENRSSTTCLSEFAEQLLLTETKRHSPDDAQVLLAEYLIQNKRHKGLKNKKLI
jgi:hypothetical protein